MITIKSIIRFEQLRRKSFFLADYTDADDVTALLYVTSGLENTYTLKAYKTLIENERWLKKEQERLSRESEILAQFQYSDTQEDGESNDTATVESIVATLVAGGINPEWLYNGMEICDLPAILDAYSKREKYRLEEQRLFTTITVMPLVKGVNNPKQLLVFPWEKEAEKQPADKEMTEKERLKAEEMFKDFLKNGLKLK